MNVAEFREWLLTQDQGAIVQVLSTESEVAIWQNFDPEDHSTYYDFRSNERTKESDPLKNKRFLELGRK